MNTITLVAAALAALTTAAPARAAEKKPAAAPATAAGKDLYAVFETSRGKIGVKLLPGEAPKTVANFVELATGKREFTDPLTRTKRKGPYFDGLLFHRVIPGFMIQGGDPATRDAPLGAASAGDLPFGVSGPGYRFDDELPKPGTILFDRPCVLAMANAGPNTNGSQFFITEGFGGAVSQLEPAACPRSPQGVCGYTRFGQGVCGCERVNEIARGGNSQTRLVKVTITSTPPDCK